MPDLHMELQQDYSNECIDNLWYRDHRDDIHLHCFQNAGKLKKFVDEFYQVTSEQYYCSELFKKEWRDTLLRVVRQRTHLMIDKIYDLVWIPCKSSCQHLLDSVIDQSITLAEVDERFSVHRCDMETQLTVLFKGITGTSEAFTDERLSEVEIAAQRIREYWELQQYYRCSNAVINVKKSLLLTGDFDEVTCLAEKV
jgi:hypothetical protein